MDGHLALGTCEIGSALKRTKRKRTGNNEKRITKLSLKFREADSSSKTPEVTSKSSSPMISNTADVLNSSSRRISKTSNVLNSSSQSISKTPDVLDSSSQRISRKPDVLNRSSSRRISKTPDVLNRSSSRRISKTPDVLNRSSPRKSSKMPEVEYVPKSAKRLSFLSENVSARNNKVNQISEKMFNISLSDVDLSWSGKKSKVTREELIKMLNESSSEDDLDILTPHFDEVEVKPLQNSTKFNTKKEKLTKTASSVCLPSPPKFKTPDKKLTGACFLSTGKLIRGKEKSPTLDRRYIRTPLFSSTGEGNLNQSKLKTLAESKESKKSSKCNTENQEIKSKENFPVLGHRVIKTPFSSSSEEDLSRFLENLKTPIEKKESKKSSVRSFLTDESFTDDEGFHLALTERIRRKKALTDNNKKPHDKESSSDSDDEVFLPKQDSSELNKLESPEKPKRNVPKFHLDSSSDSEDELLTLSERIKKHGNPKEAKAYGDKTPQITPLIQKSLASLSKQKSWSVGDANQESFLKSLAASVPLFKCHAKAVPFRKRFGSTKDELVKTLYNLFNEDVFQSKLPKDMSITWNPRLSNTAGFCYYRKNRLDVKECRIELSSKVLDSAERVRDTLIHEMCHAASWMIHGYRDGHGYIWKFWAHQAMRTFPELPVITRCHSYHVKTKYTYKCKRCGGHIGRHSKSVDIEKKVCSRCGGRFELLVNTSSGSKPVTSKPLKGFALFVKENYHQVKQSRTDLTHANIMKVLSVQYAARKG